MKVAALLWQNGERLGIVDGDTIRVRDCSPATFWAWPDTERFARLADAAPLGEVSCAQAEWLPSVPHPSKLLCVAANYLEHMREGGNRETIQSVRPQLFMKPPSTCLSAHHAVVTLPPTIQAFDWEAELAVVVGKRLFRPTPAEAEAGIAGYTICNDLSERKLCVDDTPDTRANTWFFDWLGGKWIDGSAPLGPWLVSADDIGDPQALAIKLWHNGRLMQDSSTALMMSSARQIVWYAAQICTIEPGDVIATGTPAGTGAASGNYIQRGDTIDVEIERIGRLQTRFA